MASRNTVIVLMHRLTSSKGMRYYSACGRLSSLAENSKRAFLMSMTKNWCPEINKKKKKKMPASIQGIKYHDTCVCIFHKSVGWYRQYSMRGGVKSYVVSCWQPGTSLTAAWQQILHLLCICLRQSQTGKQWLTPMVWWGRPQSSPGLSWPALSAWDRGTGLPLSWRTACITPWDCHRTSNLNFKDVPRTSKISFVHPKSIPVTSKNCQKACPLLTSCMMFAPPTYRKFTTCVDWALRTSHFPLAGVLLTAVSSIAAPFWWLRDHCVYLSRVLSWLIDVFIIKFSTATPKIFVEIIWIHYYFLIFTSYIIILLRTCVVCNISGNCRVKFYK